MCMYGMICGYVSMHACMHVCVCMYVRMHVRMYACMHARMYSCMCVRVSVCQTACLIWPASAQHCWSGCDGRVGFAESLLGLLVLKGPARSE